ncbi:MAG: hypothetical protein IJ958_04745 [Agathobacter sp.]|nr:hypothetical protein [Agathobacter sp.]
MAWVTSKETPASHHFQAYWILPPTKAYTGAQMDYTTYAGSGSLEIGL